MCPQNWRNLGAQSPPSVWHSYPDTLQSSTALLGKIKAASLLCHSSSSPLLTLPKGLQRQTSVCSLLCVASQRQFGLIEQAGHAHLCSRNACDSPKDDSSRVTPLGTPLPCLLSLLLLRAGARSIQINLQSREPGTSILLIISTNSSLEKIKTSCWQNSLRRYRLLK